MKNTYITVLISKTVGRYQIKSGHKYLELRASFFSTGLVNSLVDFFMAHFYSGGMTTRI